VCCILTAAQWTHAYLRSLAQLCRYRSRALEQHPDKHTNNGAAELAKAEADFKMLGEALEILTDTMKRQLYDEGYDKAAIDERVAAAHRAARSNDNHRGGGGHHH
jgi:DnaJ family protein C protein 7